MPFDKPVLSEVEGLRANGICAIRMREQIVNPATKYRSG